MRHHQQDHGVAVAPGELGHVLEVHPVDAGQRRRDRQEGGVGGHLAHVGVLLQALAGVGCLEHGHQQALVGLHVVVDAQEVVPEVVEVRTQLVGDVGHPTLDEPLRVGHQRRHRPAQLEVLALEQVDRLAVVGDRRGEHALLDGVEVLADLVGGLQVAVDDGIGDGVDCRERAEGQQLRPLGGVEPNLPQGSDGTHPHRDHVRGTHEQGDLAGLDGRRGLVVDHDLEHDEGSVALGELRLGPLARIEGIRDPEPRDREDLGKRIELLARGGGQGDPQEVRGISGRPPVHRPHQRDGVRRQRARGPDHLRLRRIDLGTRAVTAHSHDHIGMIAPRIGGG